MRSPSAGGSVVPRRGYARAPACDDSTLLSATVFSAMPVLSRISIAPVKGLRLLHPHAVDLDASGIPTDRRFFLVGERDELVDATDHGKLLGVVPDYEPEHERLRLVFPDATVVEGPADRLRP